MPLSAAEKMKRRREKLKENGQYEEYKKKVNEAGRKTRQKKKEKFERLPPSKKAKVIKENRKKIKERVAKHRLLKKQINQQTLNDTSIRFTPQSLGKAVARARKVLPTCPMKKRLVLEKLLAECPKENAELSRGAYGLDGKIINDIHTFYQREDISRQAPGLKDYITVGNERGEKEKIQIRHLYSSVSETYGLFVEEFGNIVGRSKFAELRPKHVYLSNKLPHNVCLCKYHENFSLAVNSLHHVIGSPYYDHNFLNGFICTVPTRACWLKDCNNCKEMLKIKLNEYLECCENVGPEVETSWFVWANHNGKLSKIQVMGTVNELIQHIVEMGPKFFEHAYIKRNQASSYHNHKTEISNTTDFEKVLIQVDYSENYTCVAQDEVQSFHWVQPQVTLFTVSLWMTGKQHPIVLVSDDRHHNKKTAMVYIDRILDDLPTDVKEVQLWSDGPASQFKNKFVIECIQQLEKKHNLHLIWNYFATSHGKGPVDGIGGALKRLVRGKVLKRKANVLNAEQFASAAKDSAVKVAVVPTEEIEARAELLKLEECFSKAPAIPGVSKCHKVFWKDNKLQKSLITNNIEE
ncbi:uncharacterized protein LOC134667550 [Cydia fagiglandana]|uniref:uncharacterized protein LOC134667550 n=1 Tax=Cydia fagiglandana TaxID=1458189 RepID=UPI002FEE2774